MVTPFPALKLATQSVVSGTKETNDSSPEIMLFSIPMVTQLSHSKLGNIGKNAGFITFAVTSVLIPVRKIGCVLKM